MKGRPCRHSMTRRISPRRIEVKALSSWLTWVPTFFGRDSLRILTYIPRRCYRQASKRSAPRSGVLAGGPVCAEGPPCRLLEAGSAERTQADLQQIGLARAQAARECVIRIVLERRHETIVDIAKAEAHLGQLGILDIVAHP